MILVPGRTDLFRAIQGNFFGHIEVEEHYGPPQASAYEVEIGLKLEIRKWGSWIEWARPREFPQRPQRFYTSNIDLGRAVHPIMYRHRTQKDFFNRFNKYLEYLEVNMSDNDGPTY